MDSHAAARFAYYFGAGRSARGAGEVPPLPNFGSIAGIPIFPLLVASAGGLVIGYALGRR